MDATSDIRERLSRALGMIADARARAGLGSGPGAVSVMAVTKNHPAAVVEAVLAAGIAVVGENRVSEGGRKIASVGRDRAEFHLVGPLHRSEVRQAVRDFHWIDTVSDAPVAAEIARRSPQPAPGAKRTGILLEVNTSGEASKHGLPPDAGALAGFLEACSGMGLSPSGLLTVGPLSLEETLSRRAFALLRELRDELESRTGVRLGELSMGMSDDFPWAVMEGATTVRLGRFLLGDRPGR